MGTIVLHAGMPKAGSSSIQAWLARQSAWLAERGRLVTVAANSPDGVQVTKYRQGPLASGAFLYAYRAFPTSRTLLDRAVSQLDRFACEFDWVVLSAEGFANLFRPPDPRFIEALANLAGRHRVHVAYYVRAQDTSMEAAWRQWGFRTGQPPSEYLAEWAQTLDYALTLRDVRDIAPCIDFDVRLLDARAISGANLIDDFALEFLDLGLDRSGTDVRWDNAGLPLDVVNILRWLPTGLLWESPHDNRRLDALRPALRDAAGPPSRQVDHGRVLLRKYCHDRFEPGNQQLISDLGWQIDSLVPEPDRRALEETELDGSVRLAIFDQLWAGPDEADRETSYRELLERVS